MAIKQKVITTKKAAIKKVVAKVVNKLIGYNDLLIVTLKITKVVVKGIDITLNGTIKLKSKFMLNGKMGDLLSFRLDYRPENRDSDLPVVFLATLTGIKKGKKNASVNSSARGTINKLAKYHLDNERETNKKYLTNLKKSK